MSKTLLTEIRNVSVIAAILSAVQILITAITGYFGTAAVLGTLLGLIVALLNFSCMGIILEKCIASNKGASGLMGFGYIGRLALIALAVIWAMKVDYLNYLCVIIPLLFPQIAIFIINIMRKTERKSEGDERT